MTVTGLTGTHYSLDSKMLSDGGEGEIYRIIGRGDKKVAKIYKSNVPNMNELEEKLTVMVNNPPVSSVLNQVAWPLDVIYDPSRKFCGFVMPELSINAELGEIYTYPSTLNISVQQKVNIAENICVVISEVHSAGYVFGDFNPRNIGLNKDTGIVSFLDTDTYHIDSGVSSKKYRCNVCAPGYAAPELLDKCSTHVANNPNDKTNVYAKTPLPTFTRETDNFALAIHIFRLLFNGYVPFGGILASTTASQASPGTGDAAVKRDNYCFKPGYKHLSTAIPPLDSFPKAIDDLLTRAFMAGKKDPKQRPTAKEWYGALKQYETTLVTCPNNSLHQYDSKNSTCPLCEADANFANAMGTPTQQPSITQNSYNPVLPPVQGSGRSLSQTYIPVQTPKLQGRHRRRFVVIGVAAIAAVAIGISTFVLNNAGVIALPFGKDSAKDKIVTYGEIQPYSPTVGERDSSVDWQIPYSQVLKNYAALPKEYGNINVQGRLPNAEYFKECLIEDLDNDGTPEFLVCWYNPETDFSSVDVYRYVDNTVEKVGTCNSIDLIEKDTEMLISVSNILAPSAYKIQDGRLTQKYGYIKINADSETVTLGNKEYDWQKLDDTELFTYVGEYYPDFQSAFMNYLGVPSFK